MDESVQIAEGRRSSITDSAHPFPSGGIQRVSSGREAGGGTAERQRHSQLRGQKRGQRNLHDNQRHTRPRHRNQRHRTPAASSQQGAVSSSSSAALPSSLDCCVVCGSAQAKYKCPKCLARYCGVECCRRHKEGGKDGEGGAEAQGCPVRNTNGDGQVQGGESADVTKSRYGIELETARRLLRLPPAPVDAAASPSSRRLRDDNNNSYDELEEGWKLTDRMVSSMSECDWLKRELQDENLRQLVSLVTAASNVVVSAPRRLRNRSDETEQERVLDRLKSELPHFRRFLDRLLVVAGVLERPRRVTDGASDMGLLEWLEQSEPADAESLTLVPVPRQFRPSATISKDGKGSNDVDADTAAGSDSVASSDESSSEDTYSSGSHSDQDDSEVE